jgi:hypothetical protein
LRVWSMTASTRCMARMLITAESIECGAPSVLRSIWCHERPHHPDLCPSLAIRRRVRCHPGRASSQRNRQRYEVMKMTKRLAVLDEHGRVRASAIFKRTKRWVDCEDRWRYDWTLVDEDRCDFGSIKRFYDLPIGTANGAPVAIPWVEVNW